MLHKFRYRIEGIAGLIVLVSGCTPSIVPPCSIIIYRPLAACRIWTLQVRALQICTLLHFSYCPPKGGQLELGGVGTKLKYLAHFLALILYKFGHRIKDIAGRIVLVTGCAPSIVSSCSIIVYRPVTACRIWTLQVRALQICALLHFLRQAVSYCPPKGGQLEPAGASTELM